MWQDNAEISELAKLDKKQMDTEKDDQGTEIEVTDMSNVTTNSDSMENSPEVDNNDTVDDDDEVEAPEPNVFRNHVLLKLIAENADFATLKSVRSLNNFCKEIVSSQLTNKSRITLNAGTKGQEQLEAIKNLKGISDLKINVKLFNGSFGFEKEGEMFIEILESFSQTLKSLELEIWANCGIPLPSPSIQFPTLSSLKIGAFDFKEETGCHLLQLIYASAPNLTELVDLNQFDFDTHLSLLLADDGSRNWALAPNLKSLTVVKNIFEKDFLHLINFPQTWESLDIMVCLDDDDAFKNIGRLVEKNKDTLVRLKLRQDPYWCRDREKLKLPTTFPKLEKLELDLFEEDCEVSSGGGPINYSKTFPALTSLSIFFGYMEYRPSRLWRSLFPPQIFNGLKHLKLTFGWDKPHHQDRIVTNWLGRMFPNATLQIYN